MRMSETLRTLMISAAVYSVPAMIAQGQLPQAGYTLRFCAGRSAMSDRRLLISVVHPDDETFGNAVLVAK